MYVFQYFSQILAAQGIPLDIIFWAYELCSIVFTPQLPNFRQTIFVTIVITIGSFQDAS